LVTVTYAHHSLIQGNRNGALYGLVATVLLAIVFTGLQGVEYTVSSFTISDGAFGSCFYFGTGFHGWTNKLNINFLKNYSTDSNKLSSHWITGFSDGESSFSLRITKNSSRKAGWRINPIFAIELHTRDLILLDKIKAFFGVGTVEIRKTRNTAVYKVQSFDSLTKVIIPHFDTYPLLTKKRADFLLFKEVLVLLNRKEQSTIEGIQKIINIRASMNKGLSEELDRAFPNTSPKARPAVNWDKIPHPDWLVGFIDGEGCYLVSIKKAKTSSGFQVKLSFSLTEHSRDELLLNRIMNYFGCGMIEKVSTRPDGVVFIVYKLSDISSKIIPFFHKYPLQGTKLLDYKYFCKVASLMENKSHLTYIDLEEIRLLKANINKERVIS
jgi:LAGLIDADG endonuclease/Cytochrome c oxidase subunit III